MILLLYAHPRPQRSIAGKALLAAVSDLPELTIRSLYDLYPDFSIDAAAERAHLTQARLVIWQHPLYWYGAPALLKLWMEEVLSSGWAYGAGGTALAGKECLWVTSTGDTPQGYARGARHGFEFDAFVPAVEQTARYCSMNWLEPMVVHGAHGLDAATLAGHAQTYRQRLLDYLSSHG